MPEPDSPAPIPRVRVLVYDLATGAILSVLTGVPEDMVAVQAQAGQGVLVTDAGDGGRSWYAPGGVLTPRPAAGFDKLTIAADGIDVAVLEMPGPFTATIDGVAHAVTDLLEIASEMPATYRVEVDHFPWLPLDVEIVAA
jgi:hypothetical protein